MQALFGEFLSFEKQCAEPQNEQSNETHALPTGCPQRCVGDVSVNQELRKGSPKKGSQGGLPNEGWQSRMTPAFHHTCECQTTLYNFKKLARARWCSASPKTVHVLQHGHSQRVCRIMCDCFK